MGFKAKYDDKRIKKKPREAKSQGTAEFLIDVPSNPEPDNVESMKLISKKRPSPNKVSHGGNVKKFKRDLSNKITEESDQMASELVNESITKSKSEDMRKMSDFKHKKIDKFKSWTQNNKIIKPARATRGFRRLNYNGDDDHDSNDKPMEFSSKKRPPILKIFTTKDQRKNRRDPRFEATSGEFDLTIFQAKYGDILKEAKRKDKDELLRELRKEKDPERISQIQYLLKRIDDQEKIEQNDKKKMEIIKKLKDEKRKQLQIAPKTPVFLNKREIKQAQLVEKYKELKASSKLSKYIEKKRKRNVARERNKMFPSES